MAMAEKAEACIGERAPVRVADREWIVVTYEQCIAALRGADDADTAGAAAADR